MRVERTATIAGLASDVRKTTVFSASMAWYSANSQYINDVQHAIRIFGDSVQLGAPDEPRHPENFRASGLFVGNPPHFTPSSGVASRELGEWLGCREHPGWVVSGLHRAVLGYCGAWHRFDTDRPEGDYDTIYGERRRPILAQACVISYQLERPQGPPRFP